MIEDLGPLHTPEEVATWMRISRRQVYHFLSVGMLAGVKCGQQWRIPERAIREFLQLESPQEGGSAGGG